MELGNGRFIENLGRCCLKKAIISIFLLAMVIGLIVALINEKWPLFYTMMGALFAVLGSASIFLVQEIIKDNKNREKRRLLLFSAMNEIKQNLSILNDIENEVKKGNGNIYIKNNKKLLSIKKGNISRHFEGITR